MKIAVENINTCRIAFNVRKFNVRHITIDQAQ